MAVFKNRKLGVLFILPQILVTLLFFIWPAYSAFWDSFFFSDAFGIQQRFAGFLNYLDLFHSPDYLQAFGVTLLIAIAITCITQVVGIMIAWLVMQTKQGQQTYKTLLIWPYAVAPAVAAILWRFLCHPNLGWLTHLSQQFGYDFNYVIHPRQALWVIILTASWQQFSYNFLFYFTAMKAIPASTMEAAILDGASVRRRFFQIMLPLLSPTTFFLIIINLIYSFFDTFGIIQIITNGGPEHSTTTLIYKLYKDGFLNLDPSSSAAQSVILMIMVMLLTLFQFRLMEKRVHYQ